MAPNSSPSINGLECLEPWLDDGNIILAVEGKHFRVHRSVLCIYSEVFRDMFSAPHAGDTEDEVIDGCPVVHLQDAAADVEILLTALYDRSFVFFPEAPMPINVLVAFLRMGKKYVIRQLFEEARRRISFNIPLLERASTLRATGEANLFPRVIGIDPFYFLIMNIASEIGLLSTALIAAVYCCLACPTLSIVGGYEFNGARCTLSASSKWHCLLVQRYLADVDKQLFKNLAYTPLTCRRPGSQNPCNAGILTILRTVHCFEHPFSTWKDSWETNLCRGCSTYSKSKYEEIRTKSWKNLPIILGLGCWENIDKNADITGASDTGELGT